MVTWAMRVLIYGGGAVGLGMGACLLQSGQSVSVIARPGTVQALRRGGLMRSGIFGEYRAQADAFEASEDVRSLAGPAFDYVLVCTKSFDSAGAARALEAAADALDSRTRIVLCQNGWGNAEVFAEHFDKQRILNARVITGFRRPQLHHVEITVHAAPIHIGSILEPADDTAADLCQAITDGGIPTAPSATIAEDLWEKMGYNCPLNPFGAILNVPYGELAESAPMRTIMNRIIDEVFAAMIAAGYRMHQSDAESFCRVFYEQLVPPTAAHRSSMLQDITAGKPTEIDALNGAVVRLGAQHGIDTPVNEMACQMIRFLESQRGAER